MYTYKIYYNCVCMFTLGEADGMRAHFLAKDVAVY